MTAREKILSRIQKSLEKTTEKPIAKPDFLVNPYLKNKNELIEVIFAENFKKNKGDFFFCEDIEPFLMQLKAFLQERKIEKIFVWETYLQELIKLVSINYLSDDKDFEEAEVGLTLCEYLIARTGSILVSSKQKAGRRLSIFPPLHIVLAFTSQLVENIKDGLEMMQEKYPLHFPSMLSLITGASQTADIEKTLVVGAHGPKEIVLFLVDDLNTDTST